MTTDNELIKVMKEAMEMLEENRHDDAAGLLDEALTQHELDLKADEADHWRDQMKDAKWDRSER